MGSGLLDFRRRASCAWGPTRVGAHGSATATCKTDQASSRKGRALTGLHGVCARFAHRLVLPSGIAQLLRTLALLDGTSRRLSRDFDVLELLRPWAQRIAQKRLSPKSVAKAALKRIRDWDRLLESAPGDMRDILTRLRRGTFDVNLRHRDLDAVVNRLVKGVLAAALFLGSTLLLSQRVPPLMGDVSLLGALGTVGAVGLGVHLLREIRRSGKR